MPYLKLFYLIILIYVLAFQASLNAQDVNIVPYLKQIERGDRDKAAAELPALQEKYPSSSSVMFLQGVLTPDGRQAAFIYTSLVKKYPTSKYADAALYRLWAYHYAIGKYSNAKNDLTKLKKGYPQSPYIKLADSDMPARDLNIKEATATTYDAIKRNDAAADNNYMYSIQAGAFIVAENANSLKSDLDSAGYFTAMDTKTIAGTTFHIVYVGKYVSRKDADSALEVINDKFNLNGRVVVNINLKQDSGN